MDGVGRMMMMKYVAIVSILVGFTGAFFQQVVPHLGWFEVVRVCETTRYVENLDSPDYGVKYKVGPTECREYGT